MSCLLWSTWNKNKLLLTTTIANPFTASFPACAIVLYSNQNIRLLKNTRSTWTKIKLSLTTIISTPFVSAFPACKIGLYGNHNIILLRNKNNVFNKQTQTNKEKNSTYHCGARISKLISGPSVLITKTVFHYFSTLLWHIQHWMCGRQIIEFSLR